MHHVGRMEKTFLIARKLRRRITETAGIFRTYLAGERRIFFPARWKAALTFHPLAAVAVQQDGRLMKKVYIRSLTRRNL